MQLSEYKKNYGIGWIKKLRTHIFHMSVLVLRIDAFVIIFRLKTVSISVQNLFPVYAHHHQCVTKGHNDYKLHTFNASCHCLPGYIFHTRK